MPLKEITQTRVARVIKKLQDSDLDEIEKAYLIDLNNHAAEGTNGLTPEQKLQNVSETVSALAELDTYGIIDRHTAAKRDKEIKESIDKLSTKIESIDKRLAVNDEKTDKVAKYLDEADKIVKKIKEAEETEKTVDMIERTIEKKESDKSGVKIKAVGLFTDLLKKIGWPGCATIVGTISVLAFRPEIIKLFKKIFENAF